MINVLFFASLKDQLNAERLELSATQNSDVKSLLTNLKDRGADWEKALSSNALMIAVNQTMSDENQVLKSGDEVAFFPPVTGG